MMHLYTVATLCFFKITLPRNYYYCNQDDTIPWVCVLKYVSNSNCCHRHLGLYIFDVQKFPYLSKYIYQQSVLNVWALTNCNHYYIDEHVWWLQRWWWWFHQWWCESRPWVLGAFPAPSPSMTPGSPHHHHHFCPLFIIIPIVSNSLHPSTSVSSLLSNYFHYSIFNPPPPHLYQNFIAFRL